MDHNQEITIAAYNQCFDQFYAGTDRFMVPEVQAWVDLALSRCSPTSKIFEIGTGLGTEADYMEEKGFSVMRSDVAESFIEYNQKKDKEIVRFDVLLDQFLDRYDMVFADAVFLHFSEAQLVTALRKIKETLLPQGQLVFCTKLGSGDETIVKKLDLPRYFKYWQADDLNNLLLKEGYVVDLLKVLPAAGGWIVVIARPANQ